MPTSIKYPTSVNCTQKTLDSALLAGVTASVTLNSVTGIQNKAGVFVVDRVDANGTATPSKREYIAFTGVSGLTLTNLTRNADGGGSDQDHAVGAIVEFVSDVLQEQAIIDGLLNVVTTAGALDTTKVVDLTTAQTLTTKTLTTPVIPSIYQDAGKTKLLTIPNTASDTLVALAATQTLINKTLTSPKINEDVALTATATQLNATANISTDGWTADTDTWVYVSASSFKIAGKDVTTKFTAGTRLKFTQTTVKYAVVVSSAFSTDTTVTIAVNTDFTIADAAITLPYYSYQLKPQGYPDWFNFTPGWTNLTPGSGTNTGSFSMIGKTVHFRTYFVFGAGSAVGDVYLTLPITIGTYTGGQAQIGRVTITDSLTATYVATIFATRELLVYVASGTYLAIAALSSSVPMTWTTNDAIEIVGTYQAA